MIVADDPQWPDGTRVAMQRSYGAAESLRLAFAEEGDAVMDVAIFVSSCTAAICSAIAEVAIAVRDGQL